MEEANGERRVTQPNATDLKEIIKMIKRMGREYLLGKVEMYIRDLM